MKVNKVILRLSSINLSVVGVTDFREFLIWDCWIGTDNTLIPKIKEMCLSNSNAIKYINDPNRVIGEFAQIKLLELYGHNIEIGDGFDENLVLTQSVLRSSMILEDKIELKEEKTEDVENEINDNFFN